MLSNTSKYAIRAVIYLAANAKPERKIGIKKISEDLDIPSPFLGKILQNLAKHKLLKSTKGPHGGFSLNQELSEITVMDIVEVIDGLDFFNNCLLGLDCHQKPEKGKECPIHEKYEPIKNQIRDFFEKQTIDGLVHNLETTERKIKL